MISINIKPLVKRKTMDRDVEGGLGEDEGVAIHSSEKHPA